MTLIQRFMTDTYTVIRSTGGQNVKGRYVPGPTEEIQVEGSLQPTSGREVKLPEEFARLHQIFKFYTDVRICSISAVTLADADRITINGEKYRAMSIDPWQGTDLDHFKSLVWREPQQ